MNKKNDYLLIFWRIFTTFLLVVLLCAFVRHYSALKECQVTYPDGTVERPGLYGNCKYMQQYISERELVNNEIWNLTPYS